MRSWLVGGHASRTSSWTRTASLYRDLFKFHIVGTSGVARVGVIVVATAQQARSSDLGQATRERTIALLPYMRAGLQLPTATIGVDVRDWSAIEARHREMQALVEANGETCRLLEVMVAAPEPSEGGLVGEEA